MEELLSIEGIQWVRNQGGMPWFLTDIAHVAAVLSRYMSKPTQEHWKAAKRVLKYLKGTGTHGL